MSGTLINTGGGGWMMQPPQPAPQQYDQWGRVVGGPGLGGLYNAVSGAMAQQQQPPNAPNLMGIGSSGYDQWGRQAPQQGQQAPALNPMQQSLANAIGSGQPDQGAMLAQILAGVPEDQVKRGGGLLGNALSERGPGADQGAAGQGY